jgi:stage II sporulation protein AA (anti-sigma F factor antagonist)
MTPHHPEALLEATQNGGVTVVRFTRRTILDPGSIEAVGARLLGLVCEEGRDRLALDFAHVESLTSSMLGKLVALHHAIEDEGGRLAFCSVGPFLRQIFTVCDLPKTIPVYADQAEAVRALSSE